MLFRSVESPRLKSASPPKDTLAHALVQYCYLTFAAIGAEHNLDCKPSSSTKNTQNEICLRITNPGVGLVFLSVFRPAAPKTYTFRIWTGNPSFRAAAPRPISKLTKFWHPLQEAIARCKASALRSEQSGFFNHSPAQMKCSCNGANNRKLSETRESNFLIAARAFVRVSRRLQIGRAHV